MPVFCEATPVNPAAESDRDGNDFAEFAGRGLERMPAEIAAKPCGADGRHVPVAGSRDLVRKPPVERHAVRVANRQQPPSRLHLAFS